MPGLGAPCGSGTTMVGTGSGGSNVIMGRVQRASTVLPGWVRKGLERTAWEIIVVTGRTLKLRQGPQDDDATVVVFSGRASDPVPRYCVAAAEETLFERAKASPIDAAAFELLENLAKSRPGVVAGTPGAGTAVTPGMVLSESTIVRRLKVCDSQPNRSPA